MFSSNIVVRLSLHILFSKVLHSGQWSMCFSLFSLMRCLLWTIHAEETWQIQIKLWIAADVETKYVVKGYPYLGKGSYPPRKTESKGEGGSRPDGALFDQGDRLLFNMSHTCPVKSWPRIPTLRTPPTRARRHCFLLNTRKLHCMTQRRSRLIRKLSH